MTLQKHNFLYFTALPPTIDKFSICAEPFHPSLVRPTATPRPRSDHLLHVPSAIHPSFQPLLNHEPTAPQPFPKHPATTLQPRFNHLSCLIQERFRHNHPSFVQSPLQAKFSLIRGRRTSPTATQPLLNHNAAKVPRFIVLSSLSAFQPKRRGRFAAILLENSEG